MQPQIARTWKSSMLMSTPDHEVYEALVDPSVTTRFWFAKSTGRLYEHDGVKWDWAMYDVNPDVEVLELVPNDTGPS